MTILPLEFGMPENKIELIVKNTQDYTNHFYNTILMIAEGFGIDVIESKIAPNIGTPDPTPVVKPPQNGLLNIEETSEDLKLSKHTLYKYTSELSIPHYKLGNKILFIQVELDDWLEKHRMKVIQ